MLHHLKCIFFRLEGALQQCCGLPCQAGDDLVEGAAVHGDAGDLHTGQKQPGSQQQPSGRAAGAGGGDDVSQPHARSHGLDGDLPGAAHVAHGAEGRGGAHGNIAALVPRLLQRAADPVHLCIDLVIGIHVQQTHLGAEELVQHQIAPVLRDAPALQQQDALHPEPRGAGGGEGRVVGLGAAGGEYRVAPLVQGLRQNEFQLADLAAAQGHAAQVIPLDPDAPAVLLAQPVQPVKRGGKHAQPDPGQIVQIPHGARPQPRSSAMRAGISSAL